MPIDTENVSTKCLDLVNRAFPDVVENRAIIKGVNTAVFHTPDEFTYTKVWSPRHGMEVIYGGNTFNDNSTIIVTQELFGLDGHTIEAGMRISTHPGWSVGGEQIAKFYYVRIPKYGIEVEVDLHSDKVTVSGLQINLRFSESVLPAIFANYQLLSHDELCYVMHDLVFCAGMETLKYHWLVQCHSIQAVCPLALLPKTVTMKDEQKISFHRVTINNSSCIGVFPFQEHV